MKEQLKLGIIGGTFNPIHIGHLIIAEQVKEILKLDKILFIPAYIPPHKKINPDEKIDDKHRVEMVKLAINGNSGFELCNYEIQCKGISYTYKTVEYLYKEYNVEGRINAIIGADLVPELKLWYEYENLIKICSFVVVDRNQINLEEYLNQYPFLKIVKTFVGIDVSSSEIRKKIKEGKSIKYLVPEKVENYLKENNLYKN
jgi:nicotinate-nucleotide adenylyltransferase